MKNKSKKLSAEEIIFEQTRDKAIKYFSGISESDEQLNDFIIDAVVDYELNKMPKVSVIGRIVATPFVFCILFFALTRQLLTMLFDFILYGGEFVVFKDKQAFKSLNHIFKKILRNKALEQSKET